jgi:hypothetical protein
MDEKHLDVTQNPITPHHLDDEKRMDVMQNLIANKIRTKPLGWLDEKKITWVPR